MNTRSFDPDGLWLKARMFVNRALDDDREFEESAFWACAAMELLGKAALARVSPLLIANPNDDGKSFLVASGLMEDTGEFSSVQAKTVWSRCQRAFRPFSENEAKKLSLGRNEYLHTARAGFDSVPEHVWWPSYWAQIQILVGQLDREMSDLVGVSRLATVEKHLATNKQYMRERLEALIEKAKTRLSQYRGGTLSPRLLVEWEAFTEPSGPYWQSVSCPACGESGSLSGDDVFDVQVDYQPQHPYDSFETPMVTVSVNADAFCCTVCHLLLSDYDLLVEANLELSFTAEGDLSNLGYEDEYNNE